MNKDIRMGVLNLHDAFLNASLIHSLWGKTATENDLQKFHFSDGARLERIWVTFLYALCESWQSVQMQEIRSFITTVVPTENLEKLIQKGKADGSLKAMFETRSYMCHRDKREYWNEGRMAHIGKLDFHEPLHQEFSKVLLAAMRHLNKEEPI